MTSRTAEQLINEVAALLGKYVPGEALGAVEHDTIDSCIDQVLEEVSGVVYVGDRDDIPLKYFETLARLIAVHAASKFSNAPLDLTAVNAHEDRLRYLSAPSRTRRTLAIDPALRPYWRGYFNGYR
ncbi:hypothetical protein [Bradyrhizobium sp. Leo121]|uniref:hypothetical protein n=1 Tax=Bradyrhizobium sp. Leo121 TaxID=1571195 RepID=UPI00102988F5|nr:hypothetical protein [Bradyrhizobium sp. Leo121]RZN21931.1 hypothetical protein CWO90_32465 [Bradyrhizobium sp. Leo121]